ncbi:MAG: hypothetical protein ACO331_14250 [Prochlorothrix sp.]
MSRRRWKSRKKSKTPWGPLLAGLLVGVPLAAEVTARVLVATQTVQLTTPTATSEEVDLAEAYQLQFVTRDGQPYGSSGSLQAQHHPLMAYTLMPGQQSQFWKINDQGFRDLESIPQAKPEGEVRIFVVGGSEAFGQMSSSDAGLFSSQLQQRLNERVEEQLANPSRFQPDILPFRADQVEAALALPPKIRVGQYRVINAAVPGYTSGNVLARLIYQISDYNPDIIIMVGGYGDLLLPSTEMGSDIPNLNSFLQAQFAPPLDKGPQWEQWGKQVEQSIHDRLYLAKLWRIYTEPLPEEEAPEPVRLVNLMADNATAPVATQLAEGTELAQRLDRYERNLLQTVRWISATQKRMLVVLSPEITGRDPAQITAAESAILSDLGAAYTSQVPPAYDQLEAVSETIAARSANVQVLNFYRLNPSPDSPLAEETLFHNPNSLTDAGQTVLADRLYQAMVNDLALTPRPFGSR